MTEVTQVDGLPQFFVGLERADDTVIPLRLGDKGPFFNEYIDAYTQKTALNRYPHTGNLGIYRIMSLQAEKDE